jgi:aminopeptidase
MITNFEARLRAFAKVVVRVGLNLQRGQRLLIAEPYELQGVARSAEVIVDAVRAAAMESGSIPAAAIEVIWGDGPRLREFAARRDWRGLTKLVAANATSMERHVQRGDALLFLQGYQARLMDGISPESVAKSRRIGWEHFGPIAQQLVGGATNWTVVPAPSSGWAGAVYADLPSAQRLAALWADVFIAMRVPLWAGRSPDDDSPGDDSSAAAVAAWQLHLQSLQRRRDELNARNLTAISYQGDGTDLQVALPAGHTWCTACLNTNSGLPFVANLPTEEVFTAPHRDSASGTVRVARPVNFGGSVIDGIELEFRQGQVVRAGARVGSDLLERLLGTDEGAGRLGEVALVESGGHKPPSADGTPDNGAAGWQNSGRLFYHPLLDENSANHVALGEAYGFCLRSPVAGVLNRSLIHVDLPIDARVISSGLVLS